MKNELIKLKIEDIEHNGLGVAKLNDKVYFVKDGILGDEVEAIITKETKSINYAKVVNYIKKSEFRVDSDCKVSKACGGCQLLELDYNKQLELKINFVKNNERNSESYITADPLTNELYFRYFEILTAEETMVHLKKNLFNVEEESK